MGARWVNGIFDAKWTAKTWVILEKRLVEGQRPSRTEPVEWRCPLKRIVNLLSALKTNPLDSISIWISIAISSFFRSIGSPTEVLVQTLGLMLKIYTYKKCSTCRKATKFLQDRQIDFEELPIRETPPSTKELERMLDVKEGKMTKILNTSSQDYRDSGWKDTLTNMKPSEVFAALQKNGNLVKRPFLLGKDIALVGFDEAEWEESLDSS
ncbi:MAG: Spx/MgsR family RNA polymerase-binding regulatory protein [Verrucomicrobiota bacterium]